MAHPVRPLRTESHAEEIFYPGEPEACADSRQRREGIALPDDTVTDLDAGAWMLGLHPRSALRDAT